MASPTPPSPILPGAKLKSLASSWKAWEKPQKTQSEPAEEDEDEEIEVQDEPDSPEETPQGNTALPHHQGRASRVPKASPPHLRRAEADPSAEDISTSPQTHRTINNFVDVLREMEDIISELEALKGRCEQLVSLLYYCQLLYYSMAHLYNTADDVFGPEGDIQQEDDDDSPFKLTEADLEILHENLDEYRVSDAPDRALLVNRVLGDLTALRDEGDDFDKGEARTETANEWSLRGPPREIQCRLALKMRGRVIRDFQEQLYRYCGIRTFVLCTWTDETNTIRACGQEYNKYIDNGVDFKSMIRDWETAPLWNSWKRYSQRCFANAMHVPAPPASGKANHEPIMIELDREGCPLVPVIADYSQHHAKVIQGAVRDFLTLHLKFVTGRKNLAISWSALKKDQFAWLQEDSLPTDLQLQDPSKMSKDDVQRLLDYWYEQEEAGIQPVEWKSTCPLLRDEPPRVSNIPRPVPRAQEPEAPLPSPQLPLMCWSQILTVLPLVEVLGAHGPFQRAPLPPCHPELVVHPQVHLWPIEAMKAHPTLVVAHHLSQQPQVGLEGDPMWQPLRRMMFLHGPFYTRSDSEMVRAYVVACTCILHSPMDMLYLWLLLILKDFAECILSLRAYLTCRAFARSVHSTRTVRVSALYALRVHYIYWDTTWVLLNTSFYVFLVMAALKTMFARSILADVALTSHKHKLSLISETVRKGPLYSIKPGGDDEIIAEARWIKLGPIGDDVEGSDAEDDEELMRELSNKEGMMMCQMLEKACEEANGVDVLVLQRQLQRLRAHFRKLDLSSLQQQTLDSFLSQSK
ncbi:hypothetical protein BC834DRAFT_992530 [Gloeopeniophorella convolvens]|nr:hypothetical protein BC834DRAFT_992530 [Gloeopeniophorella convolvens]